MLDTRKRNISPNDLRDMNPTDLIEFGREMYRKDILPRMTDEDKGMMVSMDLVSGDYEMDIRGADARSRLSRRRPDAVLHLERVGYPTPYKMVSIRIARPPQG